MSLTGDSCNLTWCTLLQTTVPTSTVLRGKLNSATPLSTSGGSASQSCQQYSDLIHVAAEEETTFNIVTGNLDYTQIAHLSADARLILMDLLEIDPEDRPTAEALLDQHEGLDDKIYNFIQPLNSLPNTHKQVTFSC